MESREHAHFVRKLRSMYISLSQTFISSILVLPDPENIYKWTGMVFPNGGFYTGGYFKFEIYFPSDLGADLAKVKFLSRIYHPLIDDEGYFHIDHMLKGHSMQDVPIGRFMSTIKSMFFIAKHADFPSDVPNPAALTMFRTNFEGFLEEVDRCVEESQGEVRLPFQTQVGLKSTIEDMPELPVLRQVILEAEEKRKENELIKNGSSEPVRYTFTSFAQTTQERIAQQKREVKQVVPSPRGKKISRKIKQMRL